MCIRDSPIAAAVKAACRKELSMERISDTEEIPGHGILARIDGKRVAAGNMKLMAAENISCEENCGMGTVIYIAVDGKYAGSIVIADRIKPEAGEAILSLKESGVRKTVMLTGDKENVGISVAGELGIDRVYANLLPGDKVTQVEVLLDELSCLLYTSRCV